MTGDVWPGSPSTMYLSFQHETHFGEPLPTTFTFGPEKVSWQTVKVPISPPHHFTPPDPAKIYKPGDEVMCADGQAYRIVSLELMTHSYKVVSLDPKYNGIGSILHSFIDGLIEP
jgi:hypothetical protein